jgi:hypothetical protein
LAQADFDPIGRYGYPLDNFPDEAFHLDGRRGLVLLAGVILAPRRTATAALRILGRDHDRIDPFAARPSLQ